LVSLVTKVFFAAEFSGGVFPRPLQLETGAKGSVSLATPRSVRAATVLFENSEVGLPLPFPDLRNDR